MSTDWNFDGDNNPEDMDEDGWANDYDGSTGTDSHPRDPNLWSDWDGNGINNDTDWDEDNVLNEDDSHPMHAHLWSDWDFDQINNDTDGDNDGVLDSQDSDPRNPSLSSDWNHDGDDNPNDWDEDGYDNGSDSHPADPNLWDDTDYDGFNAADDSHPTDNRWWSDWNNDGTNNATDGDEDGTPDYADSDPRNPALWDDWNRDGVNDSDIPPPDADLDGIPDDEDDFPEDPFNGADSDLDGLSDYAEFFQHNTDRFKVDTDGDFLTDYEELLVTHTNPLAAKTDPAQSVVDGYLFQGLDSDADGLPDLIEAHYGLSQDDPADAAGDLDGDGVSNLQAYQYGWNLMAHFEPYDGDQDRILDAVEDRWAAAHPGSLDKHVFADAVADFDGDGVMNFEEIKLGLNLTQTSTPRPDGLTDIQVLAWSFWMGGYVRSQDYALEVWQTLGTEPPAPYNRYDSNAFSLWTNTGDLNGDGTDDGLEMFRTSFTPPGIYRSSTTDSDGDGMPDVWEYRHHLNVRSNGDAGDVNTVYIPDNQPVVTSFEDFTASYAGEPNDLQLAYQATVRSFEGDLARWLSCDPDGDTLGNLREFQLGTDPRIADTDGDGYGDDVEANAGSNPTGAGSTPGNPGTGTGGSGSGNTGGTGGSTGGGTPPVIDGEVELVTRGTSGGLGELILSTEPTTKEVPFEAHGPDETEATANTKYQAAIEGAKTVVEDEEPHEIPVLWQYKNITFDPDTGTYAEEIVTQTEPKLQAAAEAEMDSVTGADLMPVAGELRWDWRVTGTREEPDEPGGSMPDGHAFSVHTWTMDAGETAITHDKDEIAGMTGDAPADWLNPVLTAPGNPLSEEEWLALGGGGLSAGTAGRWNQVAATDDGEEHYFPSGGALEVRLRRRDVSDSTLQQRVTRTFLRVTQVGDNDPEIAAVTLTIEPGHKISTEGTGPGAANGSVVLLGRPDADDKTVGVVDSLVSVGIDYISRNPTSGSFENLGSLIPESRPAPDVDMQVSNVQLTSSGGMQFTVSGAVTDSLAGLLQGGGPQDVKILFDGALLEAISLSGASGDTTPGWQPNSNQNSFTRTYTVPSVRPGPHVVRAHTGLNGANEVGWDQATIVVRKSGLAFQGKSPPASDQSASAYTDYLPIIASFAGPLSATVIDSITLTQNGGSTATLSEPTGTPAAMKFSGQSNDSRCIFELNAAPTLDPAQVDEIEATAEIISATGRISRISGTWTETGDDTKQFSPSSFGYLADTNSPTTLVVDSVQHTTKHQSAGLTPFVVRLNVPAQIAEMMVGADKKLNVTLDGQTTAIVQDEQFGVGNTKAAGMTSLFLAKNNKPRVFAAVEELQGDLIPTGVFEAGGFKVGVQNQTGGGGIMPISDAPLETDYDILAAGISAPTSGTSSPTSTSGRQPYDLNQVLCWLVVLDEMGDGKIMSLLEAYQSLGPTEFKVEVADLWDATDWDGYHIANTAERHARAGLPCIVQIDNDFPSAVHAAQALAQAILEIRSTVWRIDFETLSTGDPISDYNGMFARWGVALDNTATAAQVGLSLVNEGADWVLTVPEIAGNIRDGKNKQAGIQAAAMALPFVSGACVKKGIGLYIRVSGETIPLPPVVLDALAQASKVASDSAGRAASRVEFMRIVRPLIESGQISRELMGKLCDHGFSTSMKAQAALFYAEN